MLDQSDPFSLDASEYLPNTIDADSFSYELSDNLTRKNSDYTLEFKSDVPLISNRECLVHYTFPSELDVSNLDSSLVSGSGMFVDENGEISNSLVVSAQGQTISLRGCLFDPS